MAKPNRSNDTSTNNSKLLVLSRVAFLFEFKNSLVHYLQHLWLAHNFPDAVLFLLLNYLEDVLNAKNPYIFFAARNLLKKTADLHLDFFVTRIYFCCHCGHYLEHFGVTFANTRQHYKLDLAPVFNGECLFVFDVVFEYLCHIAFDFRAV